MMKFVVSLALLATALQTVVAQEFDLGRCPGVNPKHEFDLNAYLGTWYQYATWSTRAIQGKGKCVKNYIFYDEKSALVEIKKTQIPTSKPATPSLKGSIRYQDPSKAEGKLFVTVKMPLLGIVTVPYTVLGTDYSSWSVNYMCIDFKLFNFKSAWIYTRDPTPNAYLEEEMNTVLKRIDLSVAKFHKTEQATCEHNA